MSEGYHHTGGQPRPTAVTTAYTEGTTPAPPALSEHPGDVVGPYYLLEHIGAGGYGSVWLAERREGDLPKRVAIKIIHPGMMSAPIVARFQNEIRMLAQMDHPGLSRVFDVGTLQGRPYYVMEYVRGQQMHRYVRNAQPSRRTILELFSDVCDAVDHAHRKGVIHRDLKPTNILVSERDGRPHATVIDFGIAKALATSLLTPTVYTKDGITVGTPGYMSPEQEMGNASLVDQRSDVFSLGVVLFELLTGRLPYNLPEARDGHVHGADRVSSVADAIAAGQVDPTLRGDLETIIATAMHKDRARRYASASALAADVRKHLAGEAIEARRDSAWYVIATRTRRAVRDNPMAAALLVAAASVLLCVALVVPALFSWTSAGGWLDPVMDKAAGVVSKPPDMSGLRVVLLDGETPNSRLGELAGVEGVQDGVLPSRRLVHGKFAERLAKARPPCVVFDIGFTKESAFDAGLERGLLALHSAGVPVVVAVRERWPTPGEDPALAPAVRRTPGVTWGGITMDETHGVPLMHLALRRGDQGDAPSLALAALAQIRQPGARADVLIDHSKQQVQLRYWKLRDDANASRMTVGTPTTLPVDTVQPATPDVVSDVRVGDVVAGMRLRLASDEAYASITKSYAQVLAMTDEDLARWVDGQVVLIGDRVGDTHSVDGRAIAGTHLKANALSQLMREAGSRAPWASTLWMLLGVACVTGAGIGLRWARQNVLLALLGAGGAVLIVLIAMGVYAVLDVYVNPIVPVVGFVLACVLGAWVARSAMIGQDLEAARPAAEAMR